MTECNYEEKTIHSTITRNFKYICGINFKIEHKVFLLAVIIYLKRNKYFTADYVKLSIYISTMRCILLHIHKKIIKPATYNLFK